MAPTLIAAATALATVLCLWLLAAFMRSRADRRFELVLTRIDEHMAAIVEHVRRAGERVPTRPATPPAFEPTLELEPLLGRIAREASSRTGAPAAAVQVEGQDGVSARGSFGDPPRHELLHGPLAANPDVYRAVTVDWSHVAGHAGEQRLYASALVVPLSSDGGARGALAVYGLDSDAFGHEEVRMLESLAEEVSPLVASACRVASVEARATVDETTGLRNEKAYEQELDREVARSRRTGRPFSILVVELAEDEESDTADECVWEFAGLALEATRSTDVVCRRGERELALLLPETTADGARTVLSRLEADLAARSFRSCAPAVRSASLAEWRTGDTAGVVDVRARQGTTRTTGEAAYRPIAAPSVRTGPATRARDAREEFLGRLAAEIELTRGRSRELSLLLLEPDVRNAADGLPSVASARAILRELAARLDESLAGLTTCSRTGRNQLSVALLEATDHDAERHFAELRDWLEAHAGVTLAAGVSALVTSDRAETLFGRAQHALWQAKQTGRSSLVVAGTPDAPAV